MIQSIDFLKSDVQELPFLSENEYEDQFSKGWSLSSVYNLTEIRDVFLALRSWNQNFNLKDFFNYCNQIDLPFTRTQWNERRLLEHVNALRNFALIDEYDLTRKEFFTNSTMGSDLSPSELLTFRKVFFSYFRFKEICSWYLGHNENNNHLKFVLALSENQILNDTVPMFGFSRLSRFTDSFIYELKDGATIHHINTMETDLMRYWDVFVKWGMTLGVLEKFSLRNLNIKTIEGKPISCTYFINPELPEINLLDFINDQIQERYVYMPLLIYQLVINFRMSISYAQEFIIEQYQEHKEYLSFERTSEIFIKKTDIKADDRVLFPKYKDSYVSHIIVRQ